MFIGHYAAALTAKKFAPKISLGTLFLSAQLVDLLWPLFLLLGLEHVRIEPGNTAVTPLDFYDYPITHSLLGALGWSLGGGLLFYAIRRRMKDAAVIAFCIISHWFLDLLTHRPDLPLGFGGSTVIGLGLWNSVAATVVVEVLLFIIGIFMYLRATTAKDRIGSIGFWSLVAVLLVIYVANIFGPPPPSEQAIAVAGNASWLFVIWAYWVDRHRMAKG
jgi:hypothetical protein